MKRANPLYAALIHFPVYNKRQEIVATSITTLDLHDISRVSRTYGVEQFFAVTPLPAQQELARRIWGHWSEGHGSHYNPTRKEALGTMSVAEDLAEVVKIIEEERGISPKIVITAARRFAGSIGYDKLFDSVADGTPILVLFGTGWGLAEEIVEKADFILDPIEGGTDYNHLPVRGAFAIIMDRLLGR